MEVIAQNKKRLFIIGASSFGRELESWLQLIPESARDWELEGFLDSNQNALDGFPTNYSIVGTEDTFNFEPTDLVLLGIANPIIKKRIYHKLKNRVNFLTYIAPNAVIGKYVKIGEGTVICPNVVITTNITIGKCCTINISSNIGHDVVIGSFCSIMPNTDLGGFVNIGDESFLGTKTTVVPQRKIGNRSFIGAGSVVIRNVKDDIRVFGNPAKKIN